MSDSDFVPFETDTSPLEHDPAVIFTLDERLCVHSCNAAWDDFARSNGGSHLLRGAVIGRPVLDSISGCLKSFYRDAFEGVLATGISWRHQYECSSPERLRKFAMAVHQVRGGLMVVNSLHVEVEHSEQPARALETAYRTPDGLIVMCANCRRTRRASGSTWDWVPEFLRSSGCLVSHGICPPCDEHYRSAWFEGPAT